MRKLTLSINSAETKWLVHISQTEKCCVHFKLIKSLTTTAQWCNKICLTLAGQRTLGGPCVDSSFCHIYTNCNNICARKRCWPPWVHELCISLSPLTHNKRLWQKERDISFKCILIIKHIRNMLLMLIRTKFTIILRLLLLLKRRVNKGNALCNDLARILHSIKSVPTLCNCLCST